MLQQALRSFFRMVGVVAFKAVKFLRPQDIEHTLQAWPVKAAGSMRAQCCAARSVNCCDYLADGRKFRKAQVMLRRKDALKEIAHAAAQSLVNQIGEGTPATAASVVGITGEFRFIDRPAVARQQVNAVHILLLQQCFVVLHQLQQLFIMDINAVTQNMKR